MAASGSMSVNMMGSNRVTNAIALASRRTGVDFGYLMGQAQIESSFNPSARAGTSTATGLFQFIDQSWLKVIDDHGDQYGLDWAKDAIQQSGGRYFVADPVLREQIMDLRNHPETASVMAAEHAADNKAFLEGKLGRSAQPVDLYLAHFLGAGGAAKFLAANDADPDASAAAILPAAAHANRSIFYDRQGNPRSVGDIRASFAARLTNGASNAGVQYADLGPDADSYSSPPAQTVQPADYVRIEQQRLAQKSPDKPYADIVPTPGTARLAYLLLATYGR